jgi:hypothetical protein
MEPASHRAPPPFDFSKATKLNDLEFKCITPDVQWITKTLLTTKNLRKIRIQSHIVFADPIAETVRQEWRDLDRLLARLWTSHSIRPEITPHQLEEKHGTEFVARTCNHGGLR